VRGGAARQRVLRRPHLSRIARRLPLQLRLGNCVAPRFARGPPAWTFAVLSFRGKAKPVSTSADMRRIFSSAYWHPTLLRALVAIICFSGAVWLALAYFNPAPPSTITIATGPKGGAYEFFAQQYREKLARAHVTLNIRITDGTSKTSGCSRTQNPAFRSAL